MSSVRSKLKDQIKFVQNIGGRKLASVKSYTDEAYAAINNSLLHGYSPSKKNKDIIDDLDDLFEDVPETSHPIVVYRGVTKHDFGILTGYISTTYDYDTALSFADDKNQCCIFVISVPKGAKVLPVEDISVNPTEGEVLLPRSGNFVATRSSFAEGMEKFYLDLVLGDNLPIETEDSSESEPKTSETLKSLTNEQILNLITSSISKEEIELFGLEDTMATVVSTIEKNIGHKIDEDVLLDAMIKLK